MKAVFLDRDGVINKYPGNFEYVKSWQEFEFLPDAHAALKKLADAGFKLFVISNQAGVAKNVYSQKVLDQITDNMRAELNRHGITVEGVYYCTHLPDAGCSCRKPKTGLVEKAVAELKAKGADLELSASYFIGDSVRDVQTGKGMGLKTIMVFSGREKAENKNAWAVLPDFTAANLSEAVTIILKK
jgi:histidinol-phosphate phosphatase family protein